MRETDQMRREADELAVVSHRAYNGFAMQELQAEYALRTYNNPFVQETHTCVSSRLLSERPPSKEPTTLR